jgi:hypothetical protein
MDWRWGLGHSEPILDRLQHHVAHQIPVDAGIDDSNPAHHFTVAAVQAEGHPDALAVVGRDPRSGRACANETADSD